MDDDPFEIRLQKYYKFFLQKYYKFFLHMVLIYNSSIFEVQMDEFEEKELRRLLLDGKIEQIRLKNPLLSGKML